MESYKIIRHHKNGRRKTIAKGLFLEEVQSHCRREDTHKKDSKGNVIWFDGYEKE